MDGHVKVFEVIAPSAFNYIRKAAVEHADEFIEALGETQVDKAIFSRYWASAPSSSSSGQEESQGKKRGI